MNAEYDGFVWRKPSVWKTNPQHNQGQHYALAKRSAGDPPDFRAYTQHTKRRNPEPKRYKEDWRHALETLFHNRECASPDKVIPIRQDRPGLVWIYSYSVFLKQPVMQRRSAGFYTETWLW
jgi:hypothetical protein